VTISAETPVGNIAADHPIATRVFARHQIDFCCGGGRPIGEVCESRGLDTEAVLGELEEELAGDTSSLENWKNAPLPDLIKHIVSAYHEPLREELPRLEFMARKVLRVHGDKMPEVLPDLVSTVLSLRADLEDHMVTEEQVLFPMILDGSDPAARTPINQLEEEHAAAGDALRHLRELTSDYQPPEGACNTWRALWFGLAELEVAMHKHIHLENNILFPRWMDN
jgi:regulator of cell morphogenesis and NO signaling